MYKELTAAQYKVKEGNKWYYAAVHKWILYHFGKATECSNPDCLKKPTRRYEWALKKGFKYERDINNFIPLCVPCHKIYDFTPEQRKLNARRAGLACIQPGWPVYKLDRKTGEIIEKFANAGDAAKSIGKHRTAVLRAIHNPNFTSGKFKWKYV